MISIEGIVAGILTILLMVGLYVIRWLKAKRWVPMKAKLHHLNWKDRAMRAEVGTEVRHMVKQSQCLYSFTFSSRKYYGIKTSLVPIYSLRNPIYKKIIATVVDSPNGKIVEVFVNRNDPSKSVINRDFDRQVMVFSGLILLGLSLLGLLDCFLNPHEFANREFVLLTVLGVVIIAITLWGQSRNYRKEMKALDSIQP